MRLVTSSASVVEVLYDQLDGDPSECVPYKVFGPPFRDVEPDDRSLTPAPAQLNNLLQSGNRLLKMRSASRSFVTTEHFTLQVARSSTIAKATDRASTFLRAM
jgi:hypothetical protein